MAVISENGILPSTFAAYIIKKKNKKSAYEVSWNLPALVCQWVNNGFNQLIDLTIFFILKYVLPLHVLLKIKQRKTYGPMGISGVTTWFLKELNHKIDQKLDKIFMFSCVTHTEDCWFT